LLLNCVSEKKPIEQSSQASIVKLPEWSAINESPLVLWQEKNIVRAQQQTDLEKSKMYPGFVFGYNSSTIIGWQTIAQNIERYYGKGDRFSSFDIGLTIPIFSGAQRAKISANNMLVTQNKLERDAVKQQLSASLADASKLYLQSRKLVDNYQKNSLPNASLLIQTVSNKLQAGEIGYLEWVMVVNQAIQIKSEYFTYVQQMNDAVFEIEKLTSKN
jgi:cobalt-zinc-cadmium resistance protein CzcA